MSAMTAIRFNDEIKVFYNRLKDNEKHTTVAQVAVIKKLITVAHSLYKNDCAYDADFYNRQCGKSGEIALSA